MGNNARNAKPIKVVIADADDWQGLYINGKLVRADHSIDARDILEALGVEHYRLEVDGDWLFEDAHNDLPESVEDVKFNEKASLVKKATS